MRHTYGPDQETRWLVNWRLFFMACQETWRLRTGREYLVLSTSQDDGRFAK